MQCVPELCENKLSIQEQNLNSVKLFKMVLHIKEYTLNYQWRKNKIVLETQGEQADSWNFWEMSVVFWFIFKGKKNFPLNFIT